MTHRLRQLRQVLEATGALVVVAALLVGIPTALINFVGWPLPTVWPSLEQLRQFSQIGIADDTLAKTLAVIVWIAWLQIAVAIAAEVAAVVRRRAARPLPLFPGLQPLAARLVAAIALVAATTPTARTAAIAMPLHAAVAPAVTLPSEATLEVAPVRPDAARYVEAVPTTVVTTTSRDSWWRLAERHLGDGLRWREIRDLNDGRQAADGVVIDIDTDQVQEGWRLVVPADDDTATPHPTGAASSSPTSPGEWTVAAGEHFWDIAEHTLHESWDRPPTDTEVTPYWRDLVDDNRDRLQPPGDPDLVHPDQRFTLPPVPPDPQAAATEAPAAPSPATSTDADRGDGVDASRGTGTRDGGPTRSRTERWSAAIESHADTTPDLQPSAAGETVLEDADPEVRNGLGVPVGLTAGVAATSVLAAGVTTLLRWRRRNALRQRPEGYRLPTPLTMTAAETVRLEAAAAPEPTLDDVAALLASIPAEVHPVLVMLADDGNVTMLFEESRPVPDPPSPWRLVDDNDGPVGWTARLGDRGPERSVGLPLLVTLGRTRGMTTLLANVASMPRLTVAGDDDHVRQMLRTMTLEVSTSRLAVPVEVIVLGDGHFSTLDAVRHTDDASGELESGVAEAEQGVIAEDRSRKLLVCHNGADVPDVPSELASTVGVVAFAVDPAPDWTLRIDDVKSGCLLLPDGGTVELVLPDIDTTAIGDELDRLHVGAIPPPPAPPGTTPQTPGNPEQPIHEPEPTLTTNGQPASIAVVAPAWCEVSLLGPVEVFRDGVPVGGITPRTMEVLAYLATHRDGVTKERLDNAVWGGRAARPGSQRVAAALTKLRGVLGEGPDGEPLLPRRTGAERIRLSEHVGSDLDRAFAHLAVARDLPGELRIRELTAALDLVRGEPFEDLPVSWASDVTQRAIAELQDAALEAARIHHDRGDLDAAETVIRQGLRLLDPADALYLQLAELEKARGRPDRVVALWRELRRRHADDADDIGGLVSSPPPEIELAFQRLMVGAC